MSEQNKIEYWIRTAAYDLETAEALLEAKRFLWVGFICHLVTEKMLKAHYTKVFSTIPPYTHNLLYLAEKTGLIIQLDDLQKDFLDYLQQYNVRARYPSDKDSLYKLLDYKKSKEILIKTKEMAKWIKSKL